MSTEPAAFLPFALPDIGEEEIEEVVACLRSGWITTGPRTKQFEAEFAKFVGAKYAVAVNSCTAALHLALEAIGIRPGDSVLVPTMTFAATAEVVRYMGATPILVDCDPHTLNIDPLEIERALVANKSRPTNAARPRAMIPVHYGGLPCDMERLSAICAEHDLLMIEDAAHAFPTLIGDRHAGSFGTAGAYSFYANKNITTGEGGMLTTDDEAIADRVRMMSLHGISRDAWLRFTAQGNWYYEILAPGYKYNLTDIAAALGLVQLRRANEMLAARERIAQQYAAAFQSMDAVELPAQTPLGTTHGWHLYPLRLNLEMLSIDRARFIEELRDRGIGTSVHYIPLHIHPYYRETYGYHPEDLPVALRQYERLISLPIYSKMKREDTDRVVCAVADIAARYRT